MLLLFLPNPPSSQHTHAHTNQDDEPVQLQAGPGSGKMDFIDYDSPMELLQALLQQLGGTANIDKLCKVSLWEGFI